ncbi:DUF402 domain-containing protein [candidate division WOR-3 bacterium]|nr:DUF402 domain-containing protein [candidate division WOR-3 bacterium]
MKILEVIKLIDNTKRMYDCELISIDEEKMIVEHIRERDYDISVAILKAGGMTRAIYWKDRNFHVWKMFAPDKELIGYYINICENVQISRKQIIWTDLVLDLWVNNSGSIYWLDEDEVKEYKLKGLLSENQISVIQKTKHYLEHNYQNIISEANKCLDKK